VTVTSGYAINYLHDSGSALNGWCLFTWSRHFWL